MTTMLLITLFVRLKFNFFMNLNIIVKISVFFMIHCIMIIEKDIFHVYLRFLLRPGGITFTTFALLLFVLALALLLLPVFILA